MAVIEKEKDYWFVIRALYRVPFKKKQINSVLVVMKLYFLPSIVVVSYTNEEVKYNKDSPACIL